MSTTSQIYCFRASCEALIHLGQGRVPDWLCVRVNWQGYRIWTDPWVADVARVLGVLEVEDDPKAWKTYLESLGFQDVTPVCCEDCFEDYLYC